MPAFVSEPGNEQARRLVLRPIHAGVLDGADHPSATGERSSERDQKWEFADPWRTDEGSVAALAVTRRVGDVVMLVRIRVSDGAPDETIRLLVQQLVAVLRRTDASMVCSSVEDSVPNPARSSCSSERTGSRVSAHGSARRGGFGRRPARDGC